MISIIVICCAAGGIGIIWTIATYNQFITLKERIFNAKGQIAAQIESRWDAVHNLISATKDYAAHEAAVIEHVTGMRTTVGRSSPIEEMSRDDKQFTEVFDRIAAVAEAYPDLKAHAVYENAMENIAQFENHVRHARMIYNDCVTRLNRKVKMFPSSMIAAMFNITEEGYFETTETKRNMPNW